MGEHGIDRLRDTLRRFGRFCSALHAEHRFDRLMGLVAREVPALLDVERVVVFVLDPAAGNLRCACHAGEEAFAPAPTQGVAGRVLRTGETYVCAEPATDAEFDAAADAGIHGDVRELVGVPLKTAAGEVVGVLHVANPRGGRSFDAEDVQLAETLAGQLAAAISCARDVHRLHSERAELAADVASLREALGRDARARPLVGSSGVTRDLLSAIERARSVSLPVLLTGEVGAGKGHVARAIHHGSDRWDRRFVVHRCGGTPETLAYRDLFGAAAGIDGGPSRRKGAFERADGGTLYLEQIDELAPSLQFAVCRALRDRAIAPLRAERPVRTDVRLIASMLGEPREAVAAGRLSEDLSDAVFRFRLHVPPLRERRADVGLLAHHFLRIHVARARKVVPTGFTREAVDCLEAYGWPGNVGELDARVERIVALHGDERPLVAAGDLPPEVRGELVHPGASGGSLRETVRALEHRVISEALARHSGNRTRVAAELGLSRVGLLQKIRRYGIEG